jgi:hypothetical protein
VIYKHGVYDITQFVESHPGGNKILLAAGSTIEPFWVPPPPAPLHLPLAPCSAAMH